MRLVDVAVLAPVAGPFTYEVPEGLSASIGTRVWVPFGARAIEGVVVATRDVGLSPGALGRSGALKPLIRLVDAPPLTPSLVALARFVTDYYMAKAGEALRLVLPPGGRATDASAIALTDLGRQAAATLGAALEDPALEGLSLRARALLEKLVAAGGGARRGVLARQVEGVTAARTALVRRGLVAETRDAGVRREREEEVVRLAAGTDGSAALASESLSRSAKRRALLERVVEGGEVTLATLRAIDPSARAHVARLVEAGLVVVEKRPARRDPFGPIAGERGGPDPSRPRLTPAQTAALAALVPALEAGAFSPFLLHGATGSGKTEVYLHLIEVALAAGRGAIVLVPEISLTPQLAARFRARFGDRVAVLHSGLADRDRFEAWCALSDGRARIALGPRSAVFAPVDRLGVVVVDEEHDGSFKQEDGVRYHGRDLAVWRAKEAKAVCVLGSATPSLETFEAARIGRVGLLSLPERATRRPLPHVEIVDLRQHRLGESQPGERGFLSAPLAQALGETLAKGEQTILFLNRRGWSSFVLCTACGHRFACRHCAVTLTWHRGDDRLACHYCGYLEPTPTRCPLCQAQSVERLGLGTERIEAHVAERFPGARVARLDRDTAQGRGLERILERVRRREADVIVGTQMLAKGHDFPGVTLVGVILADGGMNVPDFRASERTFQLLAQVAGRAGRGEQPGRVFIQTYRPSHHAVACAREHDYLRFFDEERLARLDPQWPPFVRLGLLRVDGADPQAVRSAADAAGAAMRELAERAPASAEVSLLGPAEAPLSRLKGKSRWQILVKAANAKGVRAVLGAALAVTVPRGVRLGADVDPVGML